MYSSISSKLYIVKKISEWTIIFLVGEIWREENKQNLQIRHVAALTTRVIQGVELVCWPTKNRPICGFDLWRIGQHNRDRIHYR